MPAKSPSAIRRRSCSSAAGRLTRNWTRNNAAPHGISKRARGTRRAPPWCAPARRRLRAEAQAARAAPCRAGCRRRRQVRSPPRAPASTPRAPAPAPAARGGCTPLSARAARCSTRVRLTAQRGCGGARYGNSAAARSRARASAAASHVCVSVPAAALQQTEGTEEGASVASVTHQKAHRHASAAVWHSVRAPSAPVCACSTRQHAASMLRRRAQKACRSWLARTVRRRHVC